MSDKKINRTQPIKKTMELLNEAAEIVAAKKFPPNSEHPILDRFSSIAEEYNRLNRENEARKSPELKAKEAAENNARMVHAQAARKLEAATKRHKFLTALYAKYKPYDVWKLKDEAVPLLLGITPGAFEASSSEVDQTWQIASRSVLAKTLRILNPSVSPHQWLVSPTDFYLWAQSKSLTISDEFDVAFGIKRFQALAHQSETKEPPPKTAKATETKTRSKARRIAKAKEFRTWIDQQAELQGFNWRHHSIPDTKESAHRIFYLLYTDIVKVAPATFADDLHGVGIRFVSAKKTIFTNVLEQLYKTQKIPKK